eukprot:8903144-Pyramimonas_sp.AAC.1
MSKEAKTDALRLERLHEARKKEKDMTAQQNIRKMIHLKESANALEDSVRPGVILFTQRHERRASRPPRGSPSRGL